MRYLIPLALLTFLSPLWFPMFLVLFSYLIAKELVKGIDDALTKFVVRGGESDPDA